jgi:hypothetical protein
VVALASRDIALDRLRLYQRDPVAFLHDVLPREEWPRDQQAEIIDAVWNNRATLTAAHRYWGKSRTAAFVSLAFLSTQANSLVMTLAPIWEQVVQGVWVDIRHLWAVSKLPTLFPSWRVLTSEIQTHPFTPKWRAIGAAASEVANVEGKHAAAGRPTLVVMDESKGIADEFRESVKGMLVHPDSRFFAIGTPGIPFGWFYEGFTRLRTQYKTFAFRGDESPDPNVRAMVQSIADDKGWDDPYFRQQWLAEFTGADEGVIIPLSIVVPAIGRKFVGQPSWRRIMSIDPAGKGADHTVETRNIGPVMLKQIAWQGWDIVKSEQRCIADIFDWRPEIVVIDGGGLGEGVVSHVRLALKGTGIDVIEYRGGYVAKDRERYENRKAEDVYVWRDRFKEGAEEIQRANVELQERIAALKLPEGPELARISASMKEVVDAKLMLGGGRSIPNEPNLIGQICQWTAGSSSRNRTMVIDPSDSPDYADSGLMAEAALRMGGGLKGARVRGA